MSMTEPPACPVPTYYHLFVKHSMSSSYEHHHDRIILPWAVDFKGCNKLKHFTQKGSKNRPFFGVNVTRVPFGVTSVIGKLFSRESGNY